MFSDLRRHYSTSKYVSKLKINTPAKRCQKKSAIRPSSQRFHYISADLTKASEASRVIAEATAWNNGLPPDIVWCCQGVSHPTLFIDTPIEKFSEQMDSNYHSIAYVAHAILNLWLRASSTTVQTEAVIVGQKAIPRHLIFTSSVVAFYPVMGYSPYSPSKAATRALSDSLSQELELYQSTISRPVRIHTIFPATMFTQMLDQENLMKSDITKKLEEDDGGQTPDEAASAAVQGLERGDELIPTTKLGWAMMCTMLGNSKRNGIGFVETIVSWIVSIVIIFVRNDMDRAVRKWGVQHGTTGRKIIK